ncbi:O-antigen ligase [uncultured Phocaeicola sp.]|uniref:O-antigen ligase family protein n=1 Tax=uncultured Phocaeicola sp. TaxID=990718 RepID=UPI0025F158CE|nr:O-antigen ligase family protein [uncultured Phocaeicola sp.]
MIVIVAAVVLLMNSPHYNGNLTGILRLFIVELTGKYFAICYAFVSILSMNNMKPILKVSYYGLLILTAFGVLNLIIGRAWFIDTIGTHMTVSENLTDLGGKFTNSERFRVQAMFFSPFDYGYICILLLLLQLWGYVKKLVSKQQFYISAVCSIFGVLFCGCRTNILCFVIGIIVFVYYAYSMKQWIRYAMMGFFLCVIAYSTVPVIQEKVDQTMTAFDINSQTSGSSIDMRLLQYTAVLYHIRNHELFGRGLGFFNIDMGWGESQAASLVDKDLYGLEGVVMSYLLERGIIGLLLYLSFYATILYFLYRHRITDKQTSAFGLSLVFVYLAFANMTGELGSVFPTLLLIGCCMKLLYQQIAFNKISNL